MPVCYDAEFLAEKKNFRNKRKSQFFLELLSCLS